MRIGIDYHVAVSHAPGVGRYARELTRALARLDAPGLELALLDLGTEPAALDEGALGLPPGRCARVRAFLPRTWLAPVARATGIAADALLGGVELFHHTRAPHLPVRRARQTAAVAELPIAGSREEALLAERLAALDGVFVFSAHYERELARRLDVAPARLFRVPVGCEHWRRALRELPPRADPPELVVLGALAAKRRPLAVLRAFERLPGAARLVFLGRAGDAAQELLGELATSPARERVEWVREPREAALPARVARASALVHLSADEGTPVTPLEAMAMGTAVVATRLPAFAEALGREALLVEDEVAGDPRALAAHLEAALESGIDAAAARRRRSLAAGYTWERCARETCAAWSALTPRRRGE